MAEELEETNPSTTPNNIQFCILDYGIPHIYGSPPSFWIASDGSVQTQEIRSAEEDYKYTRHKYKLNPKELKQLTVLLNTLRKDNKVLKERYFIPGEHMVCIAFSLAPHSDLYVRESLVNDYWINFSEVVSFLFEIHRSKTKSLTPSSTGIWTRNMKLWQPKNYMKRDKIDLLRYSKSKSYFKAIEATEK